MRRFHIVALTGVSALSASYCYQKLKDNTTTTAAVCEQQQLPPLEPPTPQQTFYNANSHLGSKTSSNTWNYNWDSRHPNEGDSEESSLSSDGAEKEKLTPTATRHVLLIRHGQYYHAEGGDLLRKLTELGRQQAWHTGQRLQNLGIKFDRLVVSTMTRAEETGGTIAKFLPKVDQEHCSLLREGRPIRPEGKRPSTSWERNVFVDGPRIEGAFRKYIHRADCSQTEDSYDLLVCHANVIRYFVVRSMQFPPEYWLKMSLAHCGITWITIPPNGEVQIYAYGESGHLPPDLVTFSNIEPPVTVQ